MSPLSQNLILDRPVHTGARILVRGTGSIGARYISVAREESWVEAVAAFPVGRPYVGPPDVERIGDWSGALAFSPDLIVIASATSRHLQDYYDLTVAYAGSSMPRVLIEKPIVASRREFDSLSDLAGEKASTLSMASPLRFGPAFGAFKSALQGIGQLHSISIECRSYLPDWRPGRRLDSSYSSDVESGGVVRDLCHEIEYCLELFGFPEQVESVPRRTGRLGIPSTDVVDSLLVYPSWTVHLHLDYLTRPERRMSTAYGTDGSLCWQVAEGKIVQQSPNGDTEVHSFQFGRNEAINLQMQASLGYFSEVEPCGLSRSGELVDLVELVEAKVDHS